MVQIKKCVLIKTEPSIKEVISNIAEDKKFLILDVDDTNIFITENGARNIEKRVKNIMGTLSKVDREIL